MTGSHRIGPQPVEALIVAAADRELDRQTEEQLDAHLMTCPECASVAAEHSRLLDRLRPLPNADAVRHRSLSRIRASLQPRQRVPLLELGLAITVVALVVAGAVAVRRGADPYAPQREVVLESAQDAAGHQMVITVEEGRFAASPGETTGVIARAHIDLAPETTGRAELRFAAPGEAYGVLAAAPELAGLHSLSLEGRFPRPPTATTYEVWIHFVLPAPIEGPRVLVDLYPVPGGSRARMH